MRKTAELASRCQTVYGTWTYIPVCEGFSQGCPMSPVFAAMVLGVILEEVDHFFRAKAAYRKGLGDLLDDNSGGFQLSWHTWMTSIAFSLWKMWSNSYKCSVGLERS